MKKKLENMTKPELERKLDQVEQEIRRRDNLTQDDLKENESEKLDWNHQSPPNEHLAKLKTCRAAIEEELKKRAT